MSSDDSVADSLRKMVQVHPSRPFIALMPLDGAGRHQPKTAFSTP